MSTLRWSITPLPTTRLNWCTLKYILLHKRADCSCRPTLSYQRLQTTQPLSDVELYDKIRRSTSNKHELQVLESFLIFNKCVTSLNRYLSISELTRLLQARSKNQLLSANQSGAVFPSRPWLPTRNRISQKTIWHVHSHRYVTLVLNVFFAVLTSVLSI